MSAYVDADSTHAFLYPFQFKEERDTIAAYLKKSEEWKESAEHWNDTEEHYYDSYMIWQYFNEQARNIFFPGVNEKANSSDKAICCQFSYDSEITKRLTYYIATDKKTYYLRVHAITLFLFYNGVGVLSIETYTNRENPVDLEGLRVINDLGRRTVLPFFPRGGSTYILCAEELGFLLENENFYRFDKTWVTDFREIIRHRKEDRKMDAETWNQMPDFLRAAFAGKLGTGQKDALDDVIQKWGIKPVSDDRMFVFSMIKNHELSEKIRLTKDEIDDELLYQFAFVDGGSPTCQNISMRKELLKKALYLRWSKWGTLHAVTGYSFLCLTDKADIADSVYRPFLTEYFLMTVLVLAQKTSIDALSQEAARAACGTEVKGLLSHKQISRIMQLHENYVSWDNQMYLQEITEQDQGIEIYELLRKQMGVFQHMKNLRADLTDLYAVANVNQSSKISWIAAIFAVVAVGVDITLNAVNFIDYGDIKDTGFNWIIIGFLILFIIAGFFAARCKRVFE